MKNAPFHPNQRVIGLKTCSNNFGTLIKGQYYTVNACYYCERCKKWTVDIGITTECPGVRQVCIKCRGSIPGPRNIVRVSANLLAPIREVRDHKSVAVPEELLRIVERDTLEPVKTKTI